jgi:hypothetical protein
MRPDGADDSGKIQRALFITETEEYQEAIEADLARYYHLDFLDLYRPGSSLTWRKLLVLVGHLPPESALITAMRNNLPADADGGAADETKAPWSTVETLLAILIDEVRNVSWAYVQAHSDKSVPHPKAIRRPGSRKRRTAIDIANAKALDPRLRDLSDEEAADRLREMTGRG